MSCSTACPFKNTSSPAGATECWAGPAWGRYGQPPRTFPDLNAMLAFVCRPCGARIFQKLHSSERKRGGLPFSLLLFLRSLSLAMKTFGRVLIPGGLAVHNRDITIDTRIVCQISVS